MKAGAGCHVFFARVKNLAAGVCLASGVGIYITPALAANVTVIVKTSEKLEFNDNVGLLTNSDGNVYSALSSVSGDVKWRLPRLELSASTGTSYRKSAGPGKSDNLNSFEPNLTLGLLKRGITSQFSLSSSFRVQNTTFSELEDTDVTNQDSDRLTFNLTSGWTYNINSANTFTLSSSASVVDFTTSSAELSPFTNFSTQAQWVHSLTRLTSVSGSLGWSLFQSDNLQETETTTYSASGGLSTQLSPRLSVSAGGGLDFTKTKRNLIVLGVNLGENNEETLSFRSNFSLDYSLRNTQLSLSLQQGLEPSAEGQLNQRSSASFNISHKINERSSIGVSARASSREAQGDSSSEVTNQFTFDPTYTYKLAPNWGASIGYVFTIRDNDGGRAQANKVFVSLSRNATIEP